MAGYIGWHDVHFGYRNVYDGEADIARNLLVWVGVPVAFVYRGAFHRIQVAHVMDPQHLARVRQFFCDYFGWPAEQARTFKETVDIPLKRRAAIGWMAGLNALVLLAGLAAVLALAFACAVLPGGQVG